MSAPLRIVLMSGNPRAGRTTTASVLRYLAQGLVAEGIEPAHASLRAMQRDPAAAREVRTALAAGATLVLAFPVFLDTPPAQTLAWMAQLCDARTAAGEQHGSLATVVLSGYPEPAQRLHARRVCEAFAAEASLDWRGAIDFGAAPLIAGRDLEEVGVVAQAMRASLGSMAKDLAQGRPLSPTTTALAARHRLPLPAFLAPVLMNVAVRRRLRQAGVTDPRVRPYGPSQP